jgi:DNA-binding transcriptional LysR family regulator
MQIEALQVFCDVVRYRSFSQAAEAWGRTQSAVSHVVLELEKRLNVQLIDRSTRPLQLTALGQTYYEGCKALIEQYLQLEDSIREAHALLAGTVEVAAIYSVGLGDMKDIVERFQAEQPKVRVHIEYLHPNRVEERVLEGRAELGLLSFPRKSRKLTVLPWREEEMVLVCPPSHRLAQVEAVRPEQLQGEKFVAFDRELVIRREVDRFLREHNVTVDVELELDNIESIKKGIEVRGAAALLPRPTLNEEVEAGLLVARPLAEARFVRPLGIIHCRHNRLSPASQRFIELLLGGNGQGSRTTSGNGTTHRTGPNREQRGSHNGSTHARSAAR